MFTCKSLGIAVLVAAMAWSLGASAGDLGVIADDESSYVAAVEVVENDQETPAGFADALRDAVLRAAAFYGDTGRPIVLKIELDRVHFKNVAAAILIGDDNQTRGHVAVVDQAGGQELGTFKVRVDAERPGDLAAEIGLDIVGAFDPTGAVDIAHAAGNASSAERDRGGTTAAMITNFADQTLRETFGDTRAEAARARARAH